MKVTFNIDTRFEIVRLDKFLKSLIKFLKEIGSLSLIVENLNNIVNQLEKEYYLETGIDLSEKKQYEKESVGKENILEMDPADSEYMDGE